ncbi:hypothetical protein, partial [Streptomyces sp. NRRL S-495]|uniref:hypothetical protein n=1 Tax=Streptomyces sp. NRRL S-495 TaxID=1609133 RepID=UPI002570FEA3
MHRVLAHRVTAGAVALVDRRGGLGLAGGVPADPLQVLLGQVLLGLTPEPLLLLGLPQYLILILVLLVLALPPDLVLILLDLLPPLPGEPFLLVPALGGGDGRV